MNRFLYLFLFLLLAWSLVPPLVQARELYTFERFNGDIMGSISDRLIDKLPKKYHIVKSHKNPLASELLGSKYASEIWIAEGDLIAAKIIPFNDETSKDHWIRSKAIIKKQFVLKVNKFHPSGPPPDTLFKFRVAVISEDELLLQSIIQWVNEVDFSKTIEFKPEEYEILND